MNIHKNLTKRQSNIALTAVIVVIVALIALFIWFAVVAVRFLIRWFNDAVYTISAMDTVIIIALISGAITIFGLIVNSLLSLHIKNAESKFKKKSILLKKLEKPYTQFVDMLFDVVKKKEDANNINQELLDQMMREMSREIILYGSYRVVKKWATYKRKAKDLDTNEHLHYIEDLLFMIREDMGIERGELYSGELLALFVNDFNPEEEVGFNLKIGNFTLSSSKPASANDLGDPPSKKNK